MHRLPRPLATALVAAAGAVLLTGCTGQDQTKTTTTQAPVTTTTSIAGTSGNAGASGSAGASGNAEAAAFCSQAQPLLTRFGTTLGAAGQDPAALSSALQQAVAAFGAVQAPTAIASDWAAARDALAGLSTSLGTIDPTAPDAQAKVQAAVQQTETQLGPAAGRIQTYLQQNCGSAGAGTSAPTS
jgi:hypothetical protein